MVPRLSRFYRLLQPILPSSSKIPRTSPRSLHKRTASLLFPSHHSNTNQLWYAKQWTSGRWPYTIRSLHSQYGDIVRVAPNELSFASIEAHADIYAHPSKSKPLFLKAPNYDHGGPAAHIVGTRDPEDHKRQKKALAPAFSAKALREQEDIVHEYVDMFISQLENLGTGSRGIDIGKALAWVTFDIIGALTFGESFDAVKTGTTHPWVSAIVDNIRQFDLIQMRRDVPLITLLLPFVVSVKRLKGQYELHQMLTIEKTAKRIENQHKITRDDFFRHIIEKGGYSRAGLEINADVLIVAGSETASTALTGMMYYLSQYPQCYEKLQKEIRGAFASVVEISGDATAKLPYFHAVIEEGLRIYPPVAFGLKRTSPGANIGPDYIPAGTLVSTDTWTMHHHERYWHNPDVFRPERWLADGLGDNTAAFNPFSSGPRSCIGINLAYMEMRIILAKIVWHFDWELVGEVDWVGGNNAFPLWMKPEVRMRFAKRHT
jgi:cytochrome P450